MGHLVRFTIGIICTSVHRDLILGIRTVSVKLKGTYRNRMLPAWWRIFTVPLSDSILRTVL